MVSPFAPAGRMTQVRLTSSAIAALRAAPTKLNNPASSTATVGVRARVRTARATEEEASRKPLRKANAPAKTTTRAKRTRDTSGFLDDDAAHLRGDPPHVLGDFHELVRDVAVAGVLGRLHVLEHVSHPDPVGALRPFGEPEDLDPIILKVVQVVQLSHGVDRAFGLPADDFQLVGRAFGQPLQLVEENEVRGGVQLLHRLVEVAGKRVHVLAGERVQETGPHVCQEAKCSSADLASWSCMSSTSRECSLAGAPRISERVPVARAIWWAIWESRFSPAGSWGKRRSFTWGYRSPDEAYTGVVCRPWNVDDDPRMGITLPPGI